MTETTPTDREAAEHGEEHNGWDVDYEIRLASNARLTLLALLDERDAAVARAEKAEAERDAAVREIGEQARQRGRAEAEVERLREALKDMQDLCNRSVARGAIARSLSASGRSIRND